MNKFQELTASTLTPQSISSITSGSFMITSVNAKSVNDELNAIEGLDYFDLLITSHYFLSSNYVNKSNNQIVNIVPLYDDLDNIIAYYVVLEGDLYAVVNNNRRNPTVIEYGVGGNVLIDDILKLDEYHIIYNNPFDLYNINSEIAMTDLNKLPNDESYYTYYPDVLDTNVELSLEILRIKKELLKSKSSFSTNGAPLGDSEYGFINDNNMLAGKYTGKDIISIVGMDWTRTSDYNNIARNHCGAVFVTNLALYYENRGYANLNIKNKQKTFEAVHSIVGNGPKMTVARNAKTFFTNRGYTLKYSRVGSFEVLKLSVQKDRPLGVLLANGIVNWHWIMVVGYRCYTVGGNYMKIVDGWNNTSDRFYKVNSGSTWWSATSYWVGDKNEKD